LELAAVNETGEAKSFEKSEADFYPVERPHAKPPSDQ
jgi:hypothetical protein